MRDLLKRELKHALTRYGWLSEPAGRRSRPAACFLTSPDMNLAFYRDLLGDIKGAR